MAIDEDKLQICSSLRIALDEFHKASSDNKDFSRITFWQNKVRDLVNLLNALDTQEPESKKTSSRAA